MHKPSGENTTRNSQPDFTTAMDVTACTWNAPKLRRISASTGTEGKKTFFATEPSPTSPWGPS